MANLNMINILKNKYDCHVGYSGHEKGGKLVSIAAICLGATSLERHLTLDRTMYGSDQAASLELKGMKDLTNSLRKMQLAYGESRLGNIIDEELPIAKKLRSHIKI